MTAAECCYSICYSDALRGVGRLVEHLVRWVGLSGLEPLTSALSERFWPVAAQRSQDRIARPERCEASRGLASLWCAFEARESRSPLRQRPLSRSSDARPRGASTRSSRSTPRWANGRERSRTVGNETITETRVRSLPYQADPFHATCAIVGVGVSAGVHHCLWDSVAGGSQIGSRTRGGPAKEVGLVDPAGHGRRESKD